ncbi:MAG: hypothetical protein GY765_12115 [bacterium]|nr:hypothetical protein [bacterium]
MKKTMSLAVAAFMVMVLFSTPALAKKAKDPAWKSIKKIKLFDAVKVYDDPATVSAPMRTKRYVIELSQFRTALEEAGIKETVILDLTNKGRQKMATLGTYEPKIGINNVLFASIPPAVKISISNNTRIRRSADRSGMSKEEELGGDAPEGAASIPGNDENEQDRRFLLPEQGYILFKNAKKKVMARVKVKFLYLSK